MYINKKGIEWQKRREAKKRKEKQEKNHLQVVIKPDDGIEIQVVGRFVKHEQCGFDEEGPG